MICLDKHVHIETFMAAFQQSWRVLQFANAQLRANPKIIKLALQKEPERVELGGKNGKAK